MHSFSSTQICPVRQRRASCELTFPPFPTHHLACSSVRPPVVVRLPIRRACTRPLPPSSHDVAVGSVRECERRASSVWVDTSASAPAGLPATSGATVLARHVQRSVRPATTPLPANLQLAIILAAAAAAAAVRKQRHVPLRRVRDPPAGRIAPATSAPVPLVPRPAGQLHGFTHPEPNVRSPEQPVRVDVRVRAAAGADAASPVDGVPASVVQA